MTTLNTTAMPVKAAAAPASSSAQAPVQAQTTQAPACAPMAGDTNQIAPTAPEESSVLDLPADSNVMLFSSEAGHQNHGEEYITEDPQNNWAIVTSDSGDHQNHGEEYDFQPTESGKGMLV